MNHGIINKVLYSEKKLRKNSIIVFHTDVEKLRKYFVEVHCRDRYIVALKYHALKVAKSITPELTLTQLAEIINVYDHTVVSYYLNKYTPMEGHSKFISDNFNRFIDNFIYPLTTAEGAEKNKYGLYKQITLEQYRQIKSAREKEREKINQRKYTNTIKKDKKEKY
jgi:hypothetical protein